MSTDQTDLFKAAKEGNVSRLKELLGSDPKREDVNVRNTDDNKYTPLMGAAMADQKLAVDFLLEKGADVMARDSKSYTVFTLTLNQGNTDLAKHIVKRCRELKVPDFKVTDPRLKEGADWLQEHFNKTRDNIEDEQSKPKAELLDSLLKYPELGSVENRDVSHVYWEHIFLRFIGDVPKDIERNYSEDLVLTLCGKYDRILKKHDGIRESARLLNEVLHGTEYDIVGTYVSPAGSWVTERWGYRDNKAQVIDGIDTFLIQGGKITVKMINYNVTSPDSREDYAKKMGLPK